MRTFIAAFAVAASMAAPAMADGTAFAGPASWSVTATAAAPDPAHQVLAWHLPGDTASSFTYLRSTTPFADSLAAIHANFTTNKIRPSIDKDVACQGKTAHIVEFSTGPDGHKIVINRMLVPTSDGVAALTYSRADGSTFDPDVQKAEQAYCATNS